MAHAKPRAGFLNPLLLNGRKVKICKANVDEDPDFADMFGIETIPTLVFYKGGNKIGQYSGVLEKEGLKRMLEI